MMVITREHIFVTGVSRQYMMTSLSQNLHVVHRKLGYIFAQNSRYWSSINSRQTSEAALHNQKVDTGT
jgi:hypothetical protein